MGSRAWCARWSAACPSSHGAPNRSPRSRRSSLFAGLSLSRCECVHGACGARTTGPDFQRYFAQDGFAMASLEYRLTPSVTFPANVEDVRTAVRWLKANAAAHLLDPDRICLWGTSAGGHLAAVAGLAPAGTFEGTGNVNHTSAVRCVLDAYGPTRFDVMDAQTQEERAALQSPVVMITLPGAGRGAGAPPAAGARGGGRGAVPHDDPASPESRLVGGAVPSVPDRVRAASPMTDVGKQAPPFLIMHGLADGSVPHGQSVLLYESLKAADQDVTLRLVDGLAHITDPKQIAVVEYYEDNPEIPLRQHPVGRRYRTLFGDVDWSAAGLDEWLANAPPNHG